MIDIEREKREKKENILKIAKQVEEAAKDSYKELENQGIQLKKTHKDVREIDQHISKVDKNLANIEEYRRGTFRTCLGLLCCCRYCMQSGKQQVPRQRIALDLKSTKLSLNEEHLPPDRIEKEWCMRYDPEDRWIKQVELGKFVFCKFKFTFLYSLLLICLFS